GNWPCSRGLQVISHLAGRWSRVWPEAARLFQKDFKIIAAPRLSQSVERAYQSRGRFDERQIRSAGAENEVVRGVGEQTNRREESFADFGCLRSNNLEIRTQCQTVDACYLFRCKHIAI